MSAKKRFSIAPDLASGIRSTMQSAATNQGQLHYDMMSVDAIEPDPLNPRQLSVTQAELINGLNQSDANFQVKLNELEALKELSESIKRVGIRNAIEVYKEGSKYRIVSGERRYRAAILAGQKSVPVRISQKPDEFNLRYTQWVENINRQDLSLWEKYNNLVSIADAYKSTKKSEFDDKALQGLLGVSNIQSYRYFCLLKADDAIMELVQAGKIKNLKIVQELVSMKDRGALKQILSCIASSKEEVTSIANFKAGAGKKTTSAKSKGAKPISLGKINNPDAAKYLIDIVLSDTRLGKYKSNFKHIDWSSSKSIGKAFKDLFKSIENELRIEETA